MYLSCPINKILKTPKGKEHLFYLLLLYAFNAPQNDDNNSYHLLSTILYPLC